TPILRPTRRFLSCGRWSIAARSICFTHSVLPAVRSSTPCARSRSDVKPAGRGLAAGTESPGDGGGAIFRLCGLQGGAPLRNAREASSEAAESVPTIFEYSKPAILLVGAPRFELGTPSPPDGRAVARSALFSLTSCVSPFIVGS